MKNERDRLIALAGLFQAAALVEQIGRSGSADQQAAKASLFSLLQIDADSVDAVFGGLRGIVHGLDVMQRELAGDQPRNPHISRYALQLMHLEGKLRKSRERLDGIGTGIEQVRKGLEHFGLDHPNSIARIAGIYTDNISSLQPRIMVKGETVHLQNPDNANRIRALLLAGIRACMLWRQCGGNRLQIIFGRNRLLRQINRLKSEIPDLRAL